MQGIATVTSEALSLGQFAQEYYMLSLVPRRSLLTRCPREVWESAGERTPSQYWQNTPDFRAILPLVTFYEFLQLHFRKTARRWYGCVG